MWRQLFGRLWCILFHWRCVEYEPAYHSWHAHCTRCDRRWEEHD